MQKTASFVLVVWFSHKHRKFKLKLKCEKFKNFYIICLKAV
jgi:hypothetical protein